MKRKFIILFITMALCFTLLPLSAYAGAVNTDSFNSVIHASAYSPICPDLHYIIDEAKPYQLLLAGNNNIPKDSSSTYRLADYDLIFIQSVNQPTDEHYPYVPYQNLVIRGEDKHFDVYACNFEDDEWTPIVLDKNQSYIYLTASNSTGYASAILGCNYSPYSLIDGSSTEALKYFIYLPLNVDSDFSNIDYNGFKVNAENRPLTYIKLISHYFVKSFLSPLIDIIIEEPILLIIFSVGLSMFIISSVISIYKIFASFVLRKRRRKRG